MRYLQVLAATFDGASNNRRMVQLHKSSEGTLTHKVPNIHANDGKRDLFSLIHHISSRLPGIAWLLNVASYG